jgi:hypothetical protein
MQGLPAHAQFDFSARLGLKDPLERRPGRAGAVGRVDEAVRVQGV